MKVLALLDGRPGNDNQTIAIAEQLDDYQALKVEFGFWGHLPNLLLGKSLIGVETPIDQTPDVVIATGRKLARISAHLKAKTGCKAIQFMNPQMSMSNFDLIFIPQHDGYISSKNLHTTFGAPNRIDADMLESHYGKFPNGINVVLVGDLDVSEVHLLDKINDLHITTSRRTKPNTIAALRALNPAYIYEWKAANEETNENPYFALLASAKNIIVSADSVGMISESCSTGKNVYIFGKAKKSKFLDFIQRLIREGYAKPISDFGSSWEAKKLNMRDYVVKIIKNYIES